MTIEESRGGHGDRELWPRHESLGLVFSNPWLTVREEEVVFQDGTRRRHWVADVRDGVAVAATDQAGRVLLIREYRVAIRRPSWEVVNGGIDDGEAPLAAAKRELAEEAGVSARTWRSLGHIETGTGIVDCRMHMYWASDLASSPASAFRESGIQVRRTPMEGALRMIARNTIVHSPSVVTLLKLAGLTGVQQP